MSATVDTALASLDGELRRAVEVQAERIAARANDSADARLRRARADAGELAERAKNEGEAAAAAMLVRENAVVRRDAAAIVLDAKAAVLDELRSAVLDAVLALRTAPDYPELLDGLTARAIARLGPDVKIVRDPDPSGGIIADDSGRRVDYTLPALANLALAELAPTLEDLLR